MVTQVHDTGIELSTLPIYPPNAGLGKHLCGNRYNFLLSLAHRRQVWDTKLDMFCRYKAVGNSENAASNRLCFTSVPCPYYFFPVFVEML